jgi:hypothetical protein
MGSLYIVPPPNNFAWPEGGIYEQLIKAGGRPLFPMPKAVHGRTVYIAGAITDLSIAVNEELENSWLTEHDAVLFCEAFTTDALQVRAVYGMTERPAPKLAALMHGGSFIPGDTLAFAPAIESAVLSAYNLTITPSGWARRLQRQSYPSIPCEIKNWPIDGTLVDIVSRPASERRRAIVFPHRQIHEKGLDLWRMLPEHLPGVEFVGTRGGVPLITADYWKLLGETKAVFASPTMETYGIAVEEAMAAGCCPVLLEHPTYLELYKENLVHWHTGSRESAATAIAEAMTCQLKHYDNTSAIIGRKMKARAEEILSCAGSLVS